MPALESIKDQFTNPKDISSPMHTEALDLLMTQGREQRAPRNEEPAELDFNCGFGGGGGAKGGGKNERLSEDKIDNADGKNKESEKLDNRVDGKDKGKDKDSGNRTKDNDRDVCTFEPAQDGKTKESNFVGSAWTEIVRHGNDSEGDKGGCALPFNDKPENDKDKPEHKNPNPKREHFALPAPAWPARPELKPVPSPIEKPSLHGPRLEG